MLREEFCSSTNTVQAIKPRMRWAGHIARMGKRRAVYKVSVGKPEGLRRRWKDHTCKVMNLQEVIWTGPIRLTIGTGGGHL